jgi:hypothetical protein
VEESAIRMRRDHASDNASNPAREDDLSDDDFETGVSPTPEPDDKNIDPVIEQMAVLLSQQKLVPFFGAGLSRPHLGFAAAELAHEMAKRVGASPETPLSDVSDAFADKFSEGDFVDYLKSKLIVTELDEAKASAHRLLLSLTQNLIYTTNQDNIFELTAEKYGRPYRRVVTLEDLSEAIPGERLLIKFHGDTDVPSSLVFGARSYQSRMDAKDHPLDIKLRADLLGKRLLFLGYSFSDENVSKLLDAVQRAFGGKLPPSYLIAFEYDASMDTLSETYGIRIVDPLRLYPNAQTSPAAFDRCLKVLCDSTLKYQARDGLETIFSNTKVNPRMATDYEVDAVARVIETEPFETAINAFRGAFDQSIVPAHLRERVTELFRLLTDKVTATSDKEMGDLKGALFNFHLPIVFAAQAVSFVMVACNRRPARGGFDSIGMVLCPAVPDDSQPVSAAMAVAILLGRNEAISENFRRLATNWFEGWEEVHPQVRDNVQQMIEAAWRGSGSNFMPMHRPSFMPRKGFHQIMDDMKAKMPKRFKNPET